MSTRPAEIRKIKPHRVKKTFYETIEPWLFLLPALCVFGVFLYFPFFKTLYLSTFLTNKFGQAKIFYGLKNYADILYGKYSREFWNSIWVTVRFVFFVAGGGLLVGLCTSLITVNKFPGKALASAIYAMPIAIASSAAAMSFKMILHKSIGLLNHLLGTSINWLSDTTWTFPIICILSIWLASGINFIFIGAGLRNIPEELYESAAIDGAGRIRRIIHVNLPAILPVIIIQLILRIGNLMTQGYEKTILLYSPIVYEKADLISTYVYRYGLEKTQYSYGSAVGVFNSVANLIFLITANKISARLSETSLW